MKHSILLRTLFRGPLGGGARAALLIVAASLLTPAPQTRAAEAAIGDVIDMNGSALGWTTGGYGSETLWQRGVPTFGPPDGRICWGTVLDGRYPDSADGWLVSPEFTVRGRSVLTFATWFDIDNTAWMEHTSADSEFAGGYKGYLDSGRVEISIAGAGWANITAAAYPLGIPENTASNTIAGTSGDWVTAKIPLPEESIGKNVRVRFRFASDAYKQGLGNPAGWFIDDVALLPADDEGIVLRSATIEDTASGNANGIVEPGESVWVDFTLANQSAVAHTDVIGSVSCTTPGVTLPESPTPVTYGDITAGDTAAGAPRLLVSIADSVAPGTVIRLAQTITDSTGESWDVTASFLVETAVSWSGTVRETTAGGRTAASAGATVELVSDAGTYTATTTTAGAFMFPAIPAGDYSLTISKDGFADHGPVAVEVADGGTIAVTLGVAYAVVEPESFHFDLPGASSSASGAFVLRNGTSEKPGTEPLTFTVSFPDSPYGLAPAWLVWDIPEGTVPAAAAGAPIPETTLSFTIRGSGLLSDPQTNATVCIESNDCDGNASQVFEITVSCAGVTDAVNYLSVVECEAEDDPDGTSDGDGILEKGEEGFLTFTFRNESDVDLENIAIESVKAVDGSDGSNFANVVVDAASAEVTIGAHDLATNDPALPVTIPASTAPDPWYAFEVTLRDPATGLTYVTTNIVTLYDRYAVSGNVYKVTPHDVVVSNAIINTYVYTAPEGESLDLENLPAPDDGFPVRTTIDPATQDDINARVGIFPVVVTNMEALAAAMLDPEFNIDEANPADFVSVVCVTNVELVVFWETLDTNVVVTTFYKDSRGTFSIRGESTTYVNPETDDAGYQGTRTRWLVGADDEGNPVYIWHNKTDTIVTSEENEEGEVIEVETEVLYDIKVNDRVPRTKTVFDIEPVEGALVHGEGAVEDAEPAETDENGAYVLTGLRNGYAKIYATPPEGATDAVTGYVVTNGVVVTDFERAEPALFANIPEGNLDFYLLGTENTAALLLDDVAATDANGDGVFEPGETFEITGTVSNVGDLAAASVKVEAICLFPDGKDATSWPSATFPESPLESDEGLAPGETAEFGLENNVFGVVDGIATVLVKMTSVSASGATNITWGTFDIVSATTYSGTVSVDGTPFGGARLFLEELDASGNVLSTTVTTSLLPADGSSDGLGTYLFQYMGDINHDVRIRVQPSGEFLPDGLVIDIPAPQAGVHSGLDFDLTGTGFDADGAPNGAGALAVTVDGSDDLAVTHAEGESTNLVLTIANNGAETMTVNGVSVRYFRETREYGQGVPRRRALLATAPEEEAEEAESPDGQAALDLSNAVPGECFVTFRSGLSAEEQEALLAPLGVTVARRFTLIRAVHCRYDAAIDFLALRAALLATGDVLKVEPVRQLHLEKTAVFRDGLVDDPHADAQWAICNEGQTGGSWGADIDVVPLWEKGLVGSRDVIVAVMDTGVDIDHPDLIPNLWVNPGEIPDNGIDDDGNGYVDDVHGWNFALGSNDVDDPANMKGVGHGTHCAGIIGAVGNNAMGVVGVSQRVRILPIRISDDNGNLSATDADCAAAFEYIVACGASVVNCSWGHDVFFSAPILTETIQNASAAGLLVCIAASNEAKNNDAYRLSIAGLRATANVIVVAAADHDDKIAEFSNFGEDLVDIAAPGVDILSTMPEEMGPLWLSLREENGGPVYPVAARYVLMDGTSMATPYVAGAAGLLKAIDPGASMQEIRRAILDGARRDPNLQGWVATSGHLDVARAAALLGSDWLVPTTDLSADLEIAPGATAEITFDVNPALRLMAGEYGAVVDIDYEYVGEPATLGVAVTDTVTAAPFVTVASVAINDTVNGDGDGCAEPGEKVGLVLTLRNEGSLRLTSVRGTVNGTAGTWSDMASGGTASNTVPAQITMPSAEGDAAFTLALTGIAPDGSSVSFSVPFSVPVAARASVSGYVRDSDGNGIAGAVVEFWTDGTDAADALAAGDADPKRAGRVAADSTGAYRIDGLLPGAHVALRAIPDGYARSDVVVRDVSGSGTTTAEVSVGKGEVGFPSLPEDGFETTLLPGLSKVFTLAVTNLSSAPIEYRAVSISRKRVLLLSDRDSLSGLAPEIVKLGFDVDVLANNYEFVNVDYGAYKFANEEHVVYSKDPATFAPYDFVIADFDGDRRGGRQLTDEEDDALRDYLDRGGRVLVTGGSLLAMPDNGVLGALVGAADIRCRTSDATARAVFTDSVALPTWTLPGAGESSFAEVSSSHPSGAFLPGCDSEADAFSVDSAATVLASLASSGDDGAPAVSPKILRRDVGTGSLYYWGGDSGAADIAQRGVLRDILRDILYAELFEPVDWITVTSPGSFAANRLRSLMVTAQTTSLDLGDHEATVVFFGAFNDSETVAVPVTVHVVLPSFTAYVDQDVGGVTNAFGQYLKGDGGPGSCVFQLIATTDASGVISAPRASDGMPSGGEQVLASASTGLYYGRFGDTAPDQGFFRDTFDIPMANRSLWVVVRAWNGPAVGGAVWYGDSKPYKLTREMNEEHAFEPWCVGTVFNYPAEDGTAPLDSNGDGLPDGYIVENFPGMDPTASSAAQTSKEFLQKIENSAVHTPYRVFTTESYVYALCESGTSQWGITVWTTNGLAGTLVGSFVPTGDAVLQSPRGMGRQPGANRLAIADTGHSAVHVFDIDETKIDQGDVQGAFTLVYTISGAESGDAAFVKPQGVAMDDKGAVYVLDSGDGNGLPGRRVVVFNRDGSFRRAYQPTGDCNLVSPVGIGVDSTTGDIYVANTGARNIVRIAENGGDFDVYDGAYDGGTLFSAPTDVEVWRVGDTYRLLVADRGANAVHVLDSNGKLAASFANAQDATVHRLDGNFYSPWGVYPIGDSDELWVADTQNNRLQHLRFTLDGDGDGIDDTQEMLNGLDPTEANDFDTDGDGLSDAAEILIGTDPNDADTDDGGVNDGDEVAAGLDPLDESDDMTGEVNLTVSALPAEGGRVSGTGSFVIGTERTITATPSNGWFFAGWQDDGSTESPRTVTVAPGGNAYTALFERESHLVVVDFVTTNATPSDVIDGGSETHTSYYGIAFRQDYTPLFIEPYSFLSGTNTLGDTYAAPIIEFANGTTNDVTVTFVVNKNEKPDDPDDPDDPDAPQPPSITATAIAVDGTTLTASFDTDATEEKQYDTYMNDARNATVLLAVSSLEELGAYHAWRAANPDADRSAYAGDVREVSATVTEHRASKPFSFSIEADLSSWSGDSLFIIGFDKP